MILDLERPQAKNLFVILQLFSDTDNFELLDQELDLATLGLYNWAGNLDLGCKASKIAGSSL